MTKKHNNLQGEVWTKDDDVALAECVLRMVRQGSSVIDACREFEESTKGKRTAQASKFRWHTRLKDQYAAAYEIARKEGKKNRDIKRRRVNQGERYQDLVEVVLEKDDEREIMIDDVFVLLKKFKEQTEVKRNKYEEQEKEIGKLKREKEKLAKEIKDLKEERNQFKEALVEVDNNYKKLLSALRVLKDAGIQINMPEPENIKYVVNKDGTIERI